MMFMAKKLRRRIGYGKIVWKTCFVRTIRFDVKNCRGNETLEMIQPRHQPLSILGYGKSVGTTQPIEAEIIVVKDYAELEQRSAEVCT